MLKLFPRNSGDDLEEEAGNQIILKVLPCLGAGTGLDILKKEKHLNVLNWLGAYRVYF